MFYQVWQKLFPHGSARDPIDDEAAADWKMKFGNEEAHLFQHQCARSQSQGRVNCPTQFTPFSTEFSISGGDLGDVSQLWSEHKNASWLFFFTLYANI